MNDASYKRLLTHRRIIEDLLVGFIAPRRPAVWADALDFDSLREDPTENVDEARCCWRRSIAGKPKSGKRAARKAS